MNWAGPAIGIFLVAQAVSPLLAQSGSKTSCGEGSKACEPRSFANRKLAQEVPRPQRKPGRAVESNSPEQNDIQLSDSQPETNAAAIPVPACQGELRILGGEFSVPTEVPSSGECWVSNSVQLTSITTPLGSIELPGRPILKCEFALQFSNWVSSIAAPVVAGLSGAKLTAISTGPGYECRKRAGDTSAKISEHAFGNAVDIDGLVLSNGRRLEISDAGSREHPNHRLLIALRMAACGYFTTVLGPGSNAAHASHFHFDLGKHGKSGDYRICE
jgi:hypothetical protein